MLNHLKDETSPYLQQQIFSPIEWYPWCVEAFQRARMENKPIHLSIGYASCHWCHRMNRECFENAAIAARLNRDFINIKVDRQERPDIDEIYQKVLQVKGESGGWPLTIFMNAEGEPFFAGTYFAPEDCDGKLGFKSVLDSIKESWAVRHPDLLNNLKMFKETLPYIDSIKGQRESPLVDDLPRVTAEQIAQMTSADYGGIQGIPKFSNVCLYDLVLRVYYRTHNQNLLTALEKTLDGMASGGIYDQVGGGFCRYSVTEDWSIPHFEKMLYDQGLLAQLYADAYRLTGKLPWKSLCEETLDYVLRQLTHPQGAFFSAEDAESEGKEGAFYLWTPHQIFEALGKTHGDFVCRALGITTVGNFEGGRSVPQRVLSLDYHNEGELARFRHKLLGLRNLRSRVARDENIITSWNALMISGLCAGYQATGQRKYLQAASKAADFLCSNIALPNGEIFRIWHNGSRKIHGFLDDYSFLANALLDLYESCLDPKYLNRARQLTDLILRKFWSGGLYYTANDSEPLIYRPQAAHDLAMPSGISMTAFALLRLSRLFDNPFYLDFADHIFRDFNWNLSLESIKHSHLIAALEFRHQKPYEIVIAGQRELSSSLIGAVHENYLPNKVLAMAEDVPIGKDRIAIDQQPTAHICRANTCRLPVTDRAELLQQLEAT